MNGSALSRLDMMFYCCSRLENQRSPRSLLEELFLHMTHWVQGTFAFAISPDVIEDWRAFLAKQEVTIESEVRWERGGTSLYFRDPDNNLLELATPGIWPNF
jgi:catechol 2,3-dioxygenase-like lactoylglutathione lyase family enzyme